MTTAKRWLAAIVAAAIGLRLVAVVVLGDQLEVLPGIYDQLSYHTLALRLLGGYGFTFNQRWWPITAAGTPTAHWSYLYTLWLTALYALFGPHPLAARLVQAVATGALLPIFTYRIARRALPGPAEADRPHAAALVAAAWSAGYGYFIYYAAAIMTESFFLVGVLWVLDCSLRLAAPQPLSSRRTWLELGLALAVTVYLRQVFLLFVPFLLAWLVAARAAEQAGPIRHRLKAAWTHLAGGVAIAALTAAVLVAPVTVFNYLQFHRFVLLNTNAGYAFFWANHPIYGDHFVGILPNGQLYTDLIPAELVPLGQNEAALESALFQRGVGFILTEPGRYLRLSLSRIPVYFIFWPSADSGLLSNFARVISFGLALPFMLAGLAMWLADFRRRERRPSVWLSGLLVLFIVIYSLIHLLSWALPRYRLPVDAVGLIFAARALADGAALLRRRARMVYARSP
ncbi:MAG: hypothetical protein ABI847_00250 [Anaerolineales bacterium]